MPDKKKRFVLLKKYHVASFTVEAAFVVPAVVLIIVMGLHIALELQDATIKEAQKKPSVENLNPVDEMYKKGTY